MFVTKLRSCAALVGTGVAGASLVYSFARRGQGINCIVLCKTVASIRSFKMIQYAHSIVLLFFSLFSSETFEKFDGKNVRSGFEAGSMKE